VKRLNLETKAGRRSLTVTLGVMSMFPAMATDMNISAFEIIAKQFQVPIASVSLTLAVAMVGMGLGMTTWGPISDRIGRRVPALMGVGLYILGSILVMFSTSLPMMIVFRLVQSFGGSAGVIMSRSIVRDLYQGKEMARLLSAVSTIFLITPVLAPSVGALLLNWWPWQSLFAVMAGFGLVISLAIFRLPETLADENRTNNGVLASIKAYGQILQNSRFRHYAFHNAVTVAVNFSYISSTSAVYLGEFGLSKSIFALNFGITAFGQAIGAQLNHFVLRKLSVLQAMRLFVILQVTFASAIFIAGTLHANVSVVIAFQVLTMMCGGSVIANGTTLALKDFSRNTASAVALVGLAQTGTGGLVSAVLSFLPLLALQRMTGGMLFAAMLSLGALLYREFGSRNKALTAA
jgi:DHA1 family bicyclomycin/chloramphenicol resistance-like MFS transporter